jgi:hypothetical protein
MQERSCGLKFLLVLLILAWIPQIKLLGQSGFINKYDAVSFNVKMKDQGAIKNGLTCILVGKDQTQASYTPAQVRQYGLANGTVYQAQEITVNGKKQRVFLKRLVRGKVSLYSFKSKKGTRYYLAKGDTTELREISSDKKRAQEIYSAFVSDCAQALDNSKFVSLNQGSLIRFIRDYNLCSSNPLPRLTYGLLLGVSSSKPTPASIDGVLSNANWSIPR